MGWDQVCRHGTRTTGSRLNSLGDTEDFQHEYDLSDFAKISQSASKGAHGAGRSEARTIDQLRENKS